MKLLSLITLIFLFGASLQTELELKNHEKLSHFTDSVVVGKHPNTIKFTPELDWKCEKCETKDVDTDVYSIYGDGELIWNHKKESDLIWPASDFSNQIIFDDGIFKVQ